MAEKDNKKSDDKGKGYWEEHGSSIVGGGKSLLIGVAKFVGGVAMISLGIIVADKMRSGENSESSEEV